MKKNKEKSKDDREKIRQRAIEILKKYEEQNRQIREIFERIEKRFNEIENRN